MSRHHTEEQLCKAKNCTREQGGEAEVDCLFADLMGLPDSVYRSVSERLVRVAERLGLPQDRCADVVQEAWLSALEHKERFPGEHTLAELFAWLSAIVHNVSVDALRRLHRQPAQSLDNSAMEPMDRKETERAAVGEANEELAPLLARLEREAPENFWLLCQRYLASRKVRDLARETGRPAHEISDHIHRSLGKLRAWAAKSGLRSKKLPR